MDSPTPDARLPPPATSTSTGGILGSFLGRGRPRNSSQSHIDVPALNRSPSPPSHSSPHAHHGLGAMNPFAGLAAHERDARDARDRANANAASVAASGLGIPAFSGSAGAPFNAGTAQQGGGGGNGNGNGGGSNRRRPAPPAVVVAPSPSNQSSGGGLNLSHMLKRRRSAGNVATPAPGGVPPTPTPPITASRTGPPAASGGNTSGGGGAGGGQTHRIRLVPHLDSRRSLRFDPISRDLRPVPLDPALRIGRFTDRSGLGLAAVNALNGSKIAFKSKVVSRAHAEVWCEEGEFSYFSLSFFSFFYFRAIFCCVAACDPALLFGGRWHFLFFLAWRTLASFRRCGAAAPAYGGGQHE
ncbi:hypothetical protein B0H16DRAFT_846907 [Mycena metata]|uniref:FHA domain-containing protein n=1 Tax=Mycena metata TaxID=1033252 RepID=A0AAD7IWM9_9AGAR|nr:hypothetical protein B0H16DRAFT_846907 [Mycena metata]